MRASNVRETRVIHRRYAPKTKSGCTTCRIRRVKCDEAKPCCRRCTSTGRKCDGYPFLEDLEAASRKGSVQSLKPSLAIDVSCDALEKRTFDFFRARTAPCVSGYFQDGLWDRMILQVSHSEPAIRHAINALGAQHEENVLRRKAHKAGASYGAQFRTSFPVVQYAKALAGLRKLLTADEVSMNLVLMCSLLFVHFESLRESFVPALVHAENAIRLLHGSTMFNTKNIDPTLVRALMRIDVQGAMYLGMRAPGLPFYTAATDNALPSMFHDLTQARDLVETWTCRMYHFMRTKADDHKFREPGDLPLELIAKTQELAQTFVHLDRLLWEFTHRSHIRLTAREHHGLSMLRCRAKINHVLSSCCIYTEASMYDMYLEQFEKILAICMYIMESDDADRRLLSVSLDEGLLFPLYFVTTHCRDSQTRHKALELLDKLPSGRKIWHVEAITRSAHLCVEFEEAGCEKEAPKCKDIPEWRRIHSSGLDGMGVSAATKKIKVYLRTRPNGMDGEWAEIEETIECWDNTFNGNMDRLYKPSDTWPCLLGQRTDPASGYGVYNMMDMDPATRSISFCLSYWNTDALETRWLEGSRIESNDSG